MSIGRSSRAWRSRSSIALISSLPASPLEFWLSNGMSTATSLECSMVLSRVFWHYHDDFPTGVPLREITEECGIPSGEILELVASQMRNQRHRFWRALGTGSWGEELVLIGLAKRGSPDRLEC